MTFAMINKCKICGVQRHMYHMQPGEGGKGRVCKNEKECQQRHAAQQLEKNKKST
jgi:hypothetical protein